MTRTATFRRSFLACRGAATFALALSCLLSASAASGQGLPRCTGALEINEAPIIVAGNPIALEPTGETGQFGRPFHILEIATTATLRGEAKPRWSIKIEMAETSLEAFRQDFGDEVIVGIMSVGSDGVALSPTDAVRDPWRDVCPLGRLLGIKLADDTAGVAASKLKGDDLLPPSFVKAARDLDERRAWADIEAAMKQTADRCRLPLLGGAKPVVVSSSGWLVLSSHDLTGSTGVTSVADMVIEPGNEPLYVMASAHNTIWRVSGARDRLAAFVLADDSGVSGLDASLVHAVPRSCIPDFRQSYDAARPLIALNREDISSADQLIALGRKVQVRVSTLRFGVEPVLIDEARPEPGPGIAFRQRSIASIAIPSGTHSAEKLVPGARVMAGQGDAGTLWGYFMDSHPGGVVEIDPATVVSTKPLHRLEVLPAEGGFAQLIDQGAIEPIGWRDAYRLADGSILIGQRDHKEGYFRIPFVFRVKTAIRMPVYPMVFRLADPRLVLAPGVPMPTGELRAVCIKHDPIDETERIRLERGGRC